jgi:hypothetical protein
MAITKYGKYVIKKPLAIGGYGPEFVYTGEREYQSNFTIMFLRITEPTPILTTSICIYTSCLSTRIIWATLAQT